MEKKMIEKKVEIMNEKLFNYLKCKFNVRLLISVLAVFNFVFLLILFFFLRVRLNKQHIAQLLEALVVSRLKVDFEKTSPRLMSQLFLLIYTLSKKYSSVGQNCP